MAVASTFERVNSLDVLRLRAPDLRLYAVPATGTGGRAGEAPVTVGVVRERLRARGETPYALLNGAMFDLCAGNDYATTTCERLQYRALDVRAGIDVAPSGPHAQAGGTVSVVNGRFVAATGPRVAVGAVVAMQGYPLLVQDGHNVADATVNRDANWRCALVVFSELDGAFVTWRGGMHDFAEKLVQLGARWAIYSDGGGSARLMDAAGVWKGSSENRRVASVWYAAAPAGSGAIIVRDAAGQVVSAQAPHSTAQLPLWKKALIGLGIIGLGGAVVASRR
ncbi:MAG TPA: phosphodiester glycosidase family protein [Gammaproteobacteria bacterium]|nr:phosphodiester glycosidase family protein [Gammaproteobacteria bacterium]